MKLFLGYKNNNSLIHKLDPRIKLFWLLGNLSFVVFRQEIWSLLISFLLVLLINRLAEIPMGDFSTILKIISLIGIQIIILQGLLSHQGTILGQIMGFNIYLGGIFLGIKSFLVLLNLTMFCLQFTIYTSPEDLTLLLIKFHLPPKYAVLVGLALHFLPIIEKDLAGIYESQQARGLELTTLRQKIKGLMPVILPLILKALKRSEEVALSMELKGYTLHQERTFMHAIAFSRLDYKTGIVISTYFGLLLFLKGIL